MWPIEAVIGSGAEGAMTMPCRSSHGCATQQLGSKRSPARANDARLTAKTAIQLVRGIRVDFTFHPFGRLSMGPSTLPGTRPGPRGEGRTRRLEETLRAAV